MIKVSPKHIGMFSWNLWFERKPGNRQAWGPASKLSVGSLLLVVALQYIRAFGNIFAAKIFGVHALPITVVQVVLTVLVAYLSGYGIGILSRTVFEGKEVKGGPRASALFCLFCLLCGSQSLAFSGVFMLMVLCAMCSTPAALVIFPLIGAQGLLGMLQLVPRYPLPLVLCLVGLGLAYYAADRGLNGKAILGREMLSPKADTTAGTLDVD